MPRAPRPSATRRSGPARPPVVVEQTELFPERPVVERLDPRASVGPRTGVLALIRVRLRRMDAPHLVFHDRHGWYCEEHGPTCAAVREAQAADAAGPLHDPDDAADADGPLS
jgi:hypothetical protein